MSVDYIKGLCLATKRTTSPYIDIITGYSYPGEPALNQIENICVITKVTVLLFKMIGRINEILFIDITISDSQFPVRFAINKKQVNKQRVYVRFNLSVDRLKGFWPYPDDIFLKTYDCELSERIRRYSCFGFFCSNFNILNRISVKCSQFTIDYLFWARTKDDKNIPVNTVMICFINLNIIS